MRNLKGCNNILWRFYKAKVVKKQGRLILILSILTRLGKIKGQQRIIIFVRVTNTNRKKRTKQAFLNYKAKGNYVKQSLIIEYG